MGQAPLVSGGAHSTVVHVRGLCKRHGRRDAVRNVDLDVRQGQLHGLVGPDGAGKSTLMKTVAGVLTFDAGEVEVFGVRVDSEAAAERVKGRIGFMPQGLGLNLYQDLSIEENVDFFGQLRLVEPHDLAERKRRLLAMTRLDRFPRRAVKHLSGGMKQKLGLVCALIHEPELIILDEPTTGVDPVSRRDFWSTLAQLQHDRGLTALISTAYMEEADRFHSLCLLFSGDVLASGTPQELRRLVRGFDVAVRVEPQHEARERLQVRYSQVRILGPWLHALVEGADPESAAASVTQALSAMQIAEMVTDEPELEDVFVSLLSRRQLVRDAPLSRDADTGGSVRLAASRVAIQARGLTRNFGDFCAVDRVSFAVAPGEIFGLLGANGAGKTTVIKMLTGILRPTEGSGQVAGVDMRRARRAIKARIGYVSQAFSLYQDLSVSENIRLYAGIYGLSPADARRRGEWVMEMGGLAGREGDLAGSLPVGLRQRLALGCALLHRPEVLFLDEPTSGVDPLGRRQFWDIVVRLSREKGVAVLFTTHYMTEAENCDHLALMFAGRIVADATPDELKRQVAEEAGQPLEVTVDRPTLALDTLAEHGFRDVALFGRNVRVLSRDAPADASRVRLLLEAAGMGAVRPVPRAVSMEDVFLHRVTALQREETAAVAGGP